MSRSLLLSFALLTGCIAIKPTVHLGQAEEAWHDANEAESAEKAVYEHTLAEQYRLKAREEWGHSDYGASDELAQKARRYAREAEEMARYGAIDDDAERRHDILETMEETQDFVPEEVDRSEQVPEDFEDQQEDLDLDWE